jgi:uncharacterized membrane protein YoaK (UPF0700 family)
MDDENDLLNAIRGDSPDSSRRSAKEMSPGKRGSLIILCLLTPAIISVIDVLSQSKFLEDYFLVFVPLVSPVAGIAAASLWTRRANERKLLGVGCASAILFTAVSFILGFGGCMITLSISG